MLLINKIPETDFCHNFLPLLMSHLSFAHDLQFCALWFQTIPDNSGIIRKSIRDFIFKVKGEIGNWLLAWPRGVLAYLQNVEKR